MLIFFSLAAQAGDTFASHAHKQKVAESADISCVSSVLPPFLNLGKNKTKMIAAVTASFGAGAAAMATDIGEQYDDLKGAKTFSEKISQLNWGQALRKAGVQALIAGVSTGVTVYAADHPAFRNFGSKLRNLGYSRVKQILNKTGFSDETAEEFCRRFGVSKMAIAGRLTLSQIDEWVRFASKQNDKSKVMLGMWDNGGASSYITKAGTHYTYFDFRDKWDEVYNLVNKSKDEIWKINKEFIDRQKSAGKEFWFSHDPFSPKNEQFYAREVNYLIDLGVRNIQKVGDLWKAVW